jgi:hypothetical protein
MVATQYGARPMTRTASTSLGDVDLGVRIKIFDSFGANDTLRFAAMRFGLRQTVGLTYRLGKTEPDAADNFIDVGTGPGHDAIVIRSFTDVLVNDRFWATVAVGWLQGTEYVREVRVPATAEIEWLEPWRQQTSTVTPGNLLEVEVTPRWQLNELIALGTSWRWRKRSADATMMNALAVPDGYGNSEFLATGFLDSRSAWSEHRLSFSLAYSSVSATARGRARLPIEIAYTHGRSIASSGGIIPRQYEDRVQVRVYTRLFGGTR